MPRRRSASSARVRRPLTGVGLPSSVEGRARTYKPEPIFSSLPLETRFRSARPIWSYPAAERIALEMRELGRHETVDPSLGTDDVRKEADPVSTARPHIDHCGACVGSRESNQLRTLGVVHRDLRSSRATGKL